MAKTSIYRLFKEFLEKSSQEKFAVWWSAVEIVHKIVHKIENLKFREWVFFVVLCLWMEVVGMVVLMSEWHIAI